MWGNAVVPGGFQVRLPLPILIFCLCKVLGGGKVGRPHTMLLSMMGWHMLVLVLADWCLNSTTDQRKGVNCYNLNWTGVWWSFSSSCSLPAPAKSWQVRKHEQVGEIIKGRETLWHFWTLLGEILRVSVGSVGWHITKVPPGGAVSNLKFSLWQVSLGYQEICPCLQGSAGQGS